MQLFPEELALMNFKGEISSDERGFMLKEEAYEWLKEMSGEDYGDDVVKWSEWVNLSISNDDL